MRATRKSGLISILAVGLLAGSAVGVAAQGDEELEVFGYGGRAEVPEAGIAITFPDDWIWVQLGTAEVGYVHANLAAIEPRLASLVEQFIAQGIDVPPLMGIAPMTLDTASMEICNVDLRPSGGDPIEFIAGQVFASVSGRETWLEPKLTMLELPIGGVAHIQHGWRTADQELVQTIRIHLDGETQYYVLTCTGAERPDDGWLSIAETLELLPAH